MPRFYFDIEDGARSIDEEGVMLADRKHVELTAIRSLFDIARDDPQVMSGSPMTISVRDAAGETIYRATLDLRAAWVTARER